MLGDTHSWVCTQQAADTLNVWLLSTHHLPWTAAGMSPEASTVHNFIRSLNAKLFSAQWNGVSLRMDTSYETYGSAMESCNTWRPRGRCRVVAVEAEWHKRCRIVAASLAFQDKSSTVICRVLHCASIDHTSDIKAHAAARARASSQFVTLASTMPLQCRKAIWDAAAARKLTTCKLLTRVSSA